MATNGQTRLTNYCLELRRELAGYITRHDDPDPSKRFVRNGAAQEVLQKGKLIHLFQLAQYPIRDKIAASRHTDSLQSLAYKINPGSSSQPSFCNVLAILLYARCGNDTGTLQRFGKMLLNQQGVSLASDNDLPWTRSRACNVFGDSTGVTFWEQQHLFCPVILRAFQETIHEQPCPLPFCEEPIKIGDGSYAEVYKVIIEKGHLVDESDGSANLRAKAYAQKKYLNYDANNKTAFHAEWTTVKKFIDVAKTHENILKTRASLEWCGTYSLFFDLAKYDLWEYFQDRSATVTTLHQKRIVFGHTIGLAGALGYLHEELYVASDNVKLCCYHLDFKPKNILVFEHNGNEIWKISDFGISQIKTVMDGRSSIPAPGPKAFLSQTLRPRQPGIDSSSGVKNPRHGGTYTAPEATNRSKMVTRASDVWSLGCVLALVLTFLDGQSDAIEGFKAARARGKEDDWFFDDPEAVSSSTATPNLRPAVQTWLEELASKAKARNRMEGVAVGHAVGLILKDILRPVPQDRSSANEVAEKLKKITHQYVIPFPMPVEGQIRSDHWLTSQVDPSGQSHRLRDLITRHGLSKEQGLFSLEFNPLKSSKMAMFSQCGAWLGMRSTSAIRVFNVDGISKSDDGIDYKAPDHEDWEDFSMGSQQLCAASKSTYFKCSYMFLPNMKSFPQKDINTSIKSAICRVVLSPNDEVTAFVVERDVGGTKCRELALYQTRDVLNTPMQITRSSSSLSPVNIYLGQALPWKNIINRPTDRSLDAQHPILDIKFSRNSKTLILTTKVYETKQVPYQYDIHVWDVDSGVKLSKRQNKAHGFDNMTKTWKINAFTVLSHHPIFAGVSTKKLHIGFQAPPQPPAHGKHFYSSETSDEFLDIVDTEDAEELSVIGKKNGRGTIKIFRLDGNRIKEPGITNKFLDTGLQTYSPRSDCCRLTRDVENGTGKCAVLIANIKGNKAGKLSIIYFN